MEDTKKIGPAPGDIRSMNTVHPRSKSSPSHRVVARLSAYWRELGAVSKKAKAVARLYNNFSWSLFPFESKRRYNTHRYAGFFVHFQE